MSYLINNPYSSLIEIAGFKISHVILNEKIEPLYFNLKELFKKIKNNYVRAKISRKNNKHIIAQRKENCIITTPFSIDAGNVELVKQHIEVNGFEIENRSSANGYNLIINGSTNPVFDNIVMPEYIIHKDKEGDEFIIFAYDSPDETLPEIEYDEDEEDEYYNVEGSIKVIPMKMKKNLAICIDYKNKSMVKKLDNILYHFPKSMMFIKNRLQEENNCEEVLEEMVEDKCRILFPFAEK
ncbi:MAG: hypothetical protein PHW96_03075 [Candidatus Nanoarchaeia archaeon]|nr:hypothetical protein [Candidatus Nanoarchaeia archaeon]